ncbi:tRNA (adenosine(37)-N6)-dimethylallyltransferase MiaA [Anaerolineales bacterium]
MIGKHKPLITIIGPTAIGKTGFAIELAKRINGEIIGADSRQIYKQMEIGTAAPTPFELEQCPHHMIGIVEPDYNLTLAEYQEQAYEIINQIHAREKIPLLVGGTGQYITALIEGWSIPRVPPNAEIRLKWEQFAESQGPIKLSEQLRKVDPEAADNIHPNNIRRTVRALEVYEITGKPITQLQKKNPPPYLIKTIGLNMDRELLYQQADKRVDKMLAQGFLEEVERLLERYNKNLPSLSGLGYSELAAYLLDEIPLDLAIQLTKNNTHDFIRRQLIWFRNHDYNTYWLDMAIEQTDTPIDMIINWLKGLESV